MKPHTLPVKRRPAPKGIFKRLRAVTANRKQRVAATAVPEMDADDSSSKISRALTIIFLIHIVAIGLIFVHQKFLDGRAPEETKSVKAEKQETLPAPVGTQARADLPRLAKGDKSIPVRAGDNYARIAAAEGVDEGDLRLINKHVEITPGIILKIPPKRPVVAEIEQAPQLSHVAAPEESDGLVDAVDLKDAPRARLVRPNIASATSEASAVVASGKTHVVQSGENIWRIANKYKVSQDALMKANRIADARKVKIGMNLVIPR